MDILTIIKKIKFFSFIFLILFSGARASNKETKMKMGFVYHFIRYATWPDNSFKDENSPIYLIAFGTDLLAQELTSLDGKVVNSRPLDVKVTNSLDHVESPHIVYIGEEASTVTEDAINKLAKNNKVLIIGDGPGFTKIGGMIGFVRNGKRIGFKINRTAVNRQKFELSSRLLALGVDSKE